MAIGNDIIKTVGRVIFNLQRGEETTTRNIDIPNPITSAEAAQPIVNTIATTFLNSQNGMNLVIQPSTWRDNELTEEQWTTTAVRYEIIMTSTTPITPESEPEPEP